MVAKWADYLISQVQYNAEGSHIVKVLAHVDNGESVGAGTEATRQIVIARLDAGSTFCTITKNSDGKWQKGAAVFAVTIDNVRYIKTVADNTKKDNLGSLPRF